MTSAFEKRVLKSRLINHFEERGRRDISGTDSPNLVVFSDSALTAKSKKVFSSAHGSWSTSFGEAEARKLLGSKRRGF